ncbi:MAG: ankyrin repeat domain-containing protein [Gammaproteobacteria bacterium]
MKLKILFLTIAATVLSAVSPVAVADKGDDVHQKRFADYPLMHASSHGNLAEVKRLLAAGTNPNVRGYFDTTALTWAAFEGHAEIVKVLLAADANPNAATPEHGSTALMLAAGKGNAEVVKVLLAAGVNPNAADNDGDTALYYAKDRGQREIALILENYTPGKYDYLRREIGGVFAEETVAE